MKIVISLTKEYSIKKTHLMMSFFYGAGDEARTRDILLGKTVNMNKHEAFSLFSALLNKILIPRKIIHRLHIGYMDFEPRLLLIYLRIIL